MSRKVVNVTTKLFISDGNVIELITQREDVMEPVIHSFIDGINNEEVVNKLKNLVNDKRPRHTKGSCYPKTFKCKINECTNSVTMSQANKCGECGSKACHECVFKTGLYDFEKELWFCDQCKLL